MFTVSLSGASGTVRWDPRGGTAAGKATVNEDFTWTAEDGTPQWLADGGSRQVRVETVVDEDAEVAETFVLTATGPGGLSASGTGTIRDGEEEEEEVDPPQPAAWFNTRRYDEGVTVVQGRSVTENEYDQVWLPSYWPALRAGETLLSIAGERIVGSRFRPGDGLPKGLIAETEVDSFNPATNPFLLKGTVRYDTGRNARNWNKVRPGDYTFNVRSSWRKVGSSSSKVYPKKCTVTVIRAPSEMMCPDVRRFRRGSYVNMRLSIREVTESGVPAGLSVVKDSDGWYLRGIPTRDGSFKATFTKQVGGWSSSAECSFIVHSLPQPTVVAVDTSFSEGGGDWNYGYAKVRLSRVLSSDEAPVKVYIEIQDPRSPLPAGVEQATATRTVKPEKPVPAMPRPSFDDGVGEWRRYRNWLKSEAGTKWQAALAAWNAWAPPAGADYQDLNDYEDDSEISQRTVTVYPGSQTGSIAAYHKLRVLEDDTPEGNEFFWWQILRVESGDAALGGDVWGKAVIEDNDIPPPTPNGQADLPWDADPGQLRVGRPADSVLVGLPLVVYFANVKDSCRVDTLPKAKDGLCGDDIWPDNHLSPSQWRAANVVWAASPDYPDLLEGQVFTGEKIIVDLGDEFGTMTECVNDPPYGAAGHGKSAPGRRYVYNRVAAADDMLGAGECGAAYVKSGYYDLTVSVGWKQRACRGADADGNGTPEAATLVCSEPIDRESVAVKPVVVNQVLQIICWNQFGAVSNPHCSDGWQPGADGSPQWTNEPGVQRYTGSTS